MAEEMSLDRHGFKLSALYPRNLCEICNLTSAAAVHALTPTEGPIPVKFYSQHDGRAFDRPEDAANYDYYNFDMKTRRYRVTYDVTMEYREDDPSFVPNTLAVMLNTTQAKDAQLVSVESLDET